MPLLCKPTSTSVVVDGEILSRTRSLLPGSLSIERPRGQNETEVIPHSLVLFGNVPSEANSASNFVRFHNTHLAISLVCFSSKGPFSDRSFRKFLCAIIQLCVLIHLHLLGFHFHTYMRPRARLVCQKFAKCWDLRDWRSASTLFLAISLFQGTPAKL